MMDFEKITEEQGPYRNLEKMSTHESVSYTHLTLPTILLV